MKINTIFIGLCLKGYIISILPKEYATWLGDREVPDGGCVIRCGLDTILSDHEPGELNLLCGEPELLGIKHQTVLV
jgi:hypothetical protein